MGKDIRSKELDDLFHAILLLKDCSECYDFFEDICTMNELISLSQRFEVAGMLREGMAYNRITDEVSISSATISRISRCLNYGDGGYETVLRRLEKCEEETDGGVPERTETG